MLSFFKSFFVPTEENKEPPEEAQQFVDECRTTLRNSMVREQLGHYQKWFELVSKLDVRQELLNMAEGGFGCSEILKCGRLSQEQENTLVNLLREKVKELALSKYVVVEWLSHDILTLSFVESVGSLDGKIICKRCVDRCPK
jgi:hypothetical protein